MRIGNLLQKTDCRQIWLKIFFRTRAAFSGLLPNTAFAALTESWLLDEMDYTPKELINEIDIMLKNQIKGAFENL
jgi:hypothetical protein